MKKLIIYFVINFLFSMIPDYFELSNFNTENRIGIENQFADDSIVDLRKGKNNQIIAGTSGGLSLIDFI